MITDIPSKDDFDAVATALLDQAWGMATALLLDVDEAAAWQEPDDIDEYWRAANIRMATALSIAHQGAEFLIKGRLVAISPFLLIANAPRDWPKADSNGHVSFSKFRTIDAQDLVRLHDNAAAEKLHQDFAFAFESLRLQRNSIMHTVDRQLKIQIAELIENILQINKSLLPGRDWVKARREALNESPSSLLWTAEWVEEHMVKEFTAIRKLLKPKSLKDYFDFDVKQRAYLCPECSFNFDWGDYEARTAVLTPNEPDSTNVYCFICKNDTPVDRKDCQHDGCKGNVISWEHERCLTCGERQNSSEEGEDAG